MTLCIRRPRTTWTTCPCATCAADRSRMAKLARNGLYQRVPSEAAWAVIDDLRRRGWTGQAIASAADIPRYTIERAITTDEQGRRRNLSPRTSLAVVTHGDPNAGGVGAHGARRRLQGLARQGYDLATIAAGTGIGFSTVASIRNREEAEFVRAVFYVAIRDYAESVGMIIGPSSLAARHAERHGWIGLLGWEDIDDPDDGMTSIFNTAADDIDEAVVLRLLAGERMSATKPERDEAMRRWLRRGGSEAEFCRMHGWKDGRYGREVAA